MFGALNDDGGVTPPRQERSQELQKPARTAFSSFSAPIRTKPPPVERKLECTLEELCRGCKKEIKFVRNAIAANGYYYYYLSAPLLLTFFFKKKKSGAIVSVVQLFGKKKHK